MRSNGLSDFSIDIYKLPANWLGAVVNITIAVSKKSIVDCAHAIKAYWRLETQRYTLFKGPIALHKFDAG